MQISRGKEIPDSDKERIAAELMRFDKHVAFEILKVLTEALSARKNGWVRPHLFIQDGRIAKFQLQTDFVKDLDAIGG